MKISPTVLTWLVASLTATATDAFVVSTPRLAATTTTRLHAEDNNDEAAFPVEAEGDDNNAEEEEEEEALAVPVATAAPLISGPRASLPPHLTTDAWSQLPQPQIIQGNSLRTFAVDVESESVQLLLKTNGRPAHSTIDLWYGPDYNPTKLDIYLEDGKDYPLNCVFDTPYQNSVAIFNTFPQEFPIIGGVLPVNHNMKEYKTYLYSQSPPQTIQGGSIEAFTFDGNTKSIQVLLQTQGRHLDCKLELLQGPNNVKQELNIYSSDGNKRPFYAVFETPYQGCQLRVINKKTVEYPIEACIEPLVVE